MSDPSTIAYAKAFTLFSSGLLAGSTLYVSTSTIPSILSASPPPRVLQKQWQTIYDKGIVTMPPGSLVAAAMCGWLYYQGEGWQWLVAAVSAGGILPYTMAFMLPNIRRILGWVEGKKEGGEEGLRSEVALWGRLHAGRVAMLLVTFGVAIKMSVVGV